VVITDQAKKRQAGRLLAVVSTLQLHHELMRAQTRVALYVARASPDDGRDSHQDFAFQMNAEGLSRQYPPNADSNSDKNTSGRREPSFEKSRLQAGIMT
jgi:hypothetical protein